MRVTRKAVNEALEKAGFEGVTIERGDGYWYFAGTEPVRWYTSMVLVPRIGDLSVDQWVREAVALRDGR